MAQAMLKNSDISLILDSSTSNLSVGPSSKLKSKKTSAKSKSDGELKKTPKKKKRNKKNIHSGKKGHLSNKALHLMTLSKSQKRRFFRNKKYRIHLPTKFLLGGNITDPLNLNSLNDAKVNRLLNAKTPVSSPIPTPSFRKKVNVIIPKNKQDPLNLNVSDDNNAKIWRDISKKKKNRKRKRTVTISKEVEETTTNNNADVSIKPLNVDVTPSVAACTSAITSAASRKQKRIPANQIVSPAVPQHSQKARRKRTVSEGSRGTEAEGVSDVKKHKKEEIPKKKQQTPQGKRPPVTPAQPQPPQQQHKKNKRRYNEAQFIYGNYNQYYGKRNADVEDERLKLFKKHWFSGKEVLDIGCNVGHITLSIARDFTPTKIVGMDIDPKLVTIARKNVRHYLSRDVLGGESIPLSFAINYGPACADPISDTPETANMFPNNIHFVQVSLYVSHMS